MATDEVVDGWSLVSFGSFVSSPSGCSSWRTGIVGSTSVADGLLFVPDDEAWLVGVAGFGVALFVVGAPDSELDEPQVDGDGGGKRECDGD